MGAAAKTTALTETAKTAVKSVRKNFSMVIFMGNSSWVLLISVVAR